MKHRLFNFFTAMSLFLLLATLLLWLVSYGQIFVLGMRQESWPQPNVWHVGRIDFRMVRGYWTLCIDHHEFNLDHPEQIVSNETWDASRIADFQKQHVAGLHWEYLSFNASDFGSLLETPMLFVPNSFGFGGKMDRSSNISRSDSSTVFGMSAWWSVAALLVMPILKGLIIYRERTRRKEGCCRICGYDLRASPEHCPECGHLVAANGD